MIDDIEEVKRLFCPLSRADSGAGVSINRQSEKGIDPDCMCVGSDCMAWRTVDGELEHGFCGMVPVLPYQLRDGGVGQRPCVGLEIIGQPRLSGGTL